MRQRTPRDRRPLLNAIVGVLILGVAAALFWPRGGDDVGAVDSLVLTPETTSEESLQASVDAIDLPTDAETEVEESQPAAENFPVQDATLANIQPEQKPAQTQTTPSTPAPSKPIRQREGEPGAAGSYYLVVGSYSSAANADSEVERLEAAGLRASSLSADGNVRVLIGYFDSREAAEAYGRKLKQRMDLNFWIASR